MGVSGQEVEQRRIVVRGPHREYMQVDVSSVPPGNHRYVAANLDETPDVVRRLQYRLGIKP